MNKKLKVLQVVGVMNHGGAEAMLMDIFRQLHDTIDFVFLVNDHKHLLGREGAFDKEILALGGKIRYIGSQGSLGPLKYIRQMKQIVAEENPDLAHSHLNAKSGFIALALHIAGVKRIIAHCHANIKFHGSSLSNFLHEAEVRFQKLLISRYCTDFWGCSIEANNRLFYGKNLDKSLVINNAIDCAKYEAVTHSQSQSLRDSYKLPQGAIVLGNVGRIVPHKNIAFIVDILAELNKRGTPAYLVVVGRNDAKDYVDNMMANARRLGVADNIIFLGERSDIPVVMHTFDVFVGTSLREGFGLVAVEAQAAAVPCVLYKGFPPLTDMKVGLVSYLNEFIVSLWCDAILNCIGNDKPLICKADVCSKIRELSFDSFTNARHVLNLYSDYNYE